ncbi:MAG: hypothetical protein IJB20_02855 [Clostridia bacterium]|nr:hypothetical protein [Clostridia bacterium]
MSNKAWLLFDEAEQTADANPKNPEYIGVKASKRIERTRDEIYEDPEVEKNIQKPSVCSADGFVYSGTGDCLAVDRVS